MPRSLLIRDIHTLVLMDAENTVLRDAHLYIEDGEIRQVGAQPAKLPRADRTISGRHAVAVPGMVNTHHHLYQTLTRACPAAADAELFDWLRTLYPLWARLDEESVHVAVLAGMADAVEFGTAQRARVTGLKVAGKTGSVRTPTGVHLAWFAGFTDGAVVTVMLQAKSGGADAAPIAGRILEAHWKGQL